MPRLGSSAAACGVAAALLVAQPARAGVVCKPLENIGGGFANRCFGQVEDPAVDCAALALASPHWEGDIRVQRSKTGLMLGCGAGGTVRFNDGDDGSTFFDSDPTPCHSAATDGGAPLGTFHRRLFADWNRKLTWWEGHTPTDPNSFRISCDKNRDGKAVSYTDTQVLWVDDEFQDVASAQCGNCRALFASLGLAPDPTTMHERATTLFQLEVFTSTRFSEDKSFQLASTIGSADVEFFAGGKWSAKVAMRSQGAKLGQRDAEWFDWKELGCPTKVRFTMGVNPPGPSGPGFPKPGAVNTDPWGFWKVTLRQQVVAEDPIGKQGSRFDPASPFWLTADKPVELSIPEGILGCVPAALTTASTTGTATTTTTTTATTITITRTSTSTSASTTTASAVTAVTSITATAATAATAATTATTATTTATIGGAPDATGTTGAPGPETGPPDDAGVTTRATGGTALTMTAGPGGITSSDVPGATTAGDGPATTPGLGSTVAQGASTATAPVLATTAAPVDPTAAPTAAPTEPCTKQCLNGGVCARVPTDCSDPAAPTKEVCDCNPRGAVEGTCFYGATCAFSDLCFNYPGKAGTRSCTWNTVQDSFTYMFADAMCSDQPAADYCGRPITTTTTAESSAAAGDATTTPIARISDGDLALIQKQLAEEGLTQVTPEQVASADENGDGQLSDDERAKLIDADLDADGTLSKSEGRVVSKPVPPEDAEEYVERLKKTKDLTASVNEVQLADTDEDGRLSEEELDRLAEADTNGDGVITSKEATAALDPGSKSSSAGSDDESDDNSIGTGAIVGLSLALVVACIVLVLAVWFACRDDDAPKTLAATQQNPAFNAGAGMGNFVTTSQLRAPAVAALAHLDYDEPYDDAGPHHRPGPGPGPGPEAAGYEEVDDGYLGIQGSGAAYATPNEEYSASIASSAPQYSVANAGEVHRAAPPANAQQYGGVVYGTPAGSARSGAQSRPGAAVNSTYRGVAGAGAAGAARPPSAPYRMIDRNPTVAPRSNRPTGVAVNQNTSYLEPSPGSSGAYDSAEYDAIDDEVKHDYEKWVAANVGGRNRAKASFTDRYSLFSAEDMQAFGESRDVYYDEGSGGVGTMSTVAQYAIANEADTPGYGGSVASTGIQYAVANEGMTNYDLGASASQRSHSTGFSVHYDVGRPRVASNFTPEMAARDRAARAARAASAEEPADYEYNDAAQLPTGPAPAARKRSRCVHRSAESGLQCKQSAAPGSARCERHTCSKAGCVRPKLSSQSYCVECASPSSPATGGRLMRARQGSVYNGFADTAEA